VAEIEVRPVEVRLTPVEARTFFVTVPAPNPVVQLVMEGPQGPGVPRGGNVNDVLAKTGVNDFETGWTDAPTVDALNFDLTAAEGEPDTGELVWNAEEGTLDLGLNGNEGAFIHLGQETVYRVTNTTGTTIPKGAVCRFAGTVGNSGRLLAALFDAAVHPAKTVMGLAAEAIPNDGDGYVVAFGKVRKIKTDFAGWVEGDILYAAAGTPGGLTRIQPTSPNAIVTVAALVTRSAQVGEVFVRPTFAPVLTETQDVRITNPQDGDVLVYDAALGYWKNQQP
jgi:hypothetical protein